MLARSGCEAREPDDWANIGRYAAANAALKAPAPGEHRVVFMGNSITDFWIKQSPEFFSENGYLDRGISGQTSYQMVVRFRKDVIELKPEIVVINAGTNDCAENTCPFDIDQTMGNIQSMVELAEMHGIQVVLASVLPAAAFSWNEAITDAPMRIEALNERIKEYARAKKIPYVDYHTAMLAANGQSLNLALSDDGVHPNLQGYKIMEPLVKTVIDNMINVDRDK